MTESETVNERKEGKEVEVAATTSLTKPVPAGAEALLRITDGILGTKSRTGGGTFIEKVVGLFARDDPQVRVQAALDKAKEEFEYYRIDASLKAAKQFVDLQSGHHATGMKADAEIERVEQNLQRSVARAASIRAIESDRKVFLDAFAAQFDTETQAMKTKYSQLLDDAVDRRKRALEQPSDIDVEYRDKNYFDGLIVKVTGAFDSESQRLIDEYRKKRQETNLRYDERIRALEG